jgi:methylglutaconyl-CoA hydratase
MTKRLVHYVLRHDEADNLIYTVDRLADFWETEEAREGMQSFFDRRKPAWHRKPAQARREAAP